MWRWPWQRRSTATAFERKPLLPQTDFLHPLLPDEGPFRVAELRYCCEGGRESSYVDLVLIVGSERRTLRFHEPRGDLKIFGHLDPVWVFDIRKRQLQDDRVFVDDGDDGGILSFFASRVVDLDAPAEPETDESDS